MATSEKFRGLPGVVSIDPDRYIDPVNNEYRGDKYEYGVVIPRRLQHGRGYGQPKQDGRGYGRPKQDGRGYGRPLQDGRGFGPPPHDGRGYGQLQDGMGFGQARQDGRGFGQWQAATCDLPTINKAETFVGTVVLRKHEGHALM